MIFDTPPLVMDPSVLTKLEHAKEEMRDYYFELNMISKNKMPESNVSNEDQRVKLHYHTPHIKNQNHSVLDLSVPIATTEGSGSDFLTKLGRSLTQGGQEVPIAKKQQPKRRGYGWNVPNYGGGFQGPSTIPSAFNLPPTVSHGTTSAPNPIMIIVVLAALGIAGYLLYHKLHKAKAEEKELGQKGE